MALTSKVFLALLAAGSWTFQPALAQQRSYDIMVDEGGKPLKRNPKSVVPDSGEVKKVPRKKGYPRGSSYIPPATLPRTEAIVTSPAPGVYKPPPINTFSDRVRNCIHSYPLNAGIGNNPTDQGAYVRQCAN